MAFSYCYPIFSALLVVVILADFCSGFLPSLLDKIYFCSSAVKILKTVIVIFMHGGFQSEYYIGVYAYQILCDIYIYIFIAKFITLKKGFFLFLPGGLKSNFLIRVYTFTVFMYQILLCLNQK